MFGGEEVGLIALISIDLEGEKGPFYRRRYRSSRTGAWRSLSHCSQFLVKNTSHGAYPKRLAMKICTKTRTGTDDHQKSNEIGH